MSHFNISRNDVIYETSFEGNDYLAIENSRRIIKEENNIYTSIIAANLLIHRAKNIDTGLKLYDFVINCSSTYNYLDILIQALDNKWRMIHHHPSLVKRPLEEALQIIEKIRSYQPEYTNTELVIMYDFTLNDNEKAEQEYIKLILIRLIMMNFGYSIQ